MDTQETAAGPDHSVLRITPSPENVRLILTVIAAYEDEVDLCGSYVIDWESGLDPRIVDEVLDYLWAQDMVECRVGGTEGREPAVIDVRRVLVGRDRRWG